MRFVYRLYQERGSAERTNRAQLWMPASPPSADYVLLRMDTVPLRGLKVSLRTSREDMPLLVRHPRMDCRNQGHRDVTGSRLASQRL